MNNNNSNNGKRKASKRYVQGKGKLRGVPLDRKNGNKQEADSARTKLRPNNRQQRSNKEAQRRTPVKIIPLGGLNEIGKNFTVIECSNDMFVIDCGLAFPDSEMLGVDIVIPDFTYVEKNLEKMRGVVITHGHEDHIGGLPYFLKKFPGVPVYGTRLTVGLIEGKLREHGLLDSVKLNTVTPRQTIRMGCMAVEFIRVNHSIPDSVGMAIHTPAGVLIHTGDFKVDYTPIEGGIIDLPRFAELGNKGVLALMADSTNSERPGYTASERKVGDNLEMLFSKAEGKRIIIATFASNIHRVQQIINNAVNTGRKVADAVAGNRPDELCLPAAVQDHRRDPVADDRDHRAEDQRGNAPLVDQAFSACQGKCRREQPLDDECRQRIDRIAGKHICQHSADRRSADRIGQRQHRRRKKDHRIAAVDIAVSDRDMQRRRQQRGHCGKYARLDHIEQLLIFILH